MNIVARPSFAQLGLLCLIVPAVVLAAAPITGSNENDDIKGTDKGEEIRGGDGDDRLHGGAGDDVLIGGRGTDIMYGGSGSDRFIIDFRSDLPDEIMDFRPEEGDTVWLRFKETPQPNFPRKIEIQNIQIDFDGDVEIQLINEEQFKIVKLKRSDLTLKVDDLGDDVRLTFTKKLGKN